MMHLQGRKHHTQVNVHIVPSNPLMGSNNMAASSIIGNGDGALDDLVEMPEIRKYKKKFNSDIHCAALWGNCIFVC